MVRAKECWWWIQYGNSTSGFSTIHIVHFSPALIVEALCKWWINTTGAAITFVGYWCSFFIVILHSFRSGGLFVSIHWEMNKKIRFDSIFKSSVSENITEILRNNVRKGTDNNCYMIINNKHYCNCIELPLWMRSIGFYCILKFSSSTYFISISNFVLSLSKL